ncbi:MAG: hypothetical protein HOL04_01190 [Gammaproteobacteria bacterium]|nr:hypothetical protein [Gammaproteobacteria bacterium]MBT4812051.1 hypothetical protein [Thiotrichales bacterium]MBT3966539.1 hypothetical protein [Gammaproteobacteria bacterium]MBT5360335.1 hypothetical protein [Gammaproteobacteria bacterium]MBT5634464.1 hypothetical protein [Gammaproteobacteria bacterium]
MSMNQVMTVLDEDIRRGKLDPDVVKIAKAHREKCFGIAKGTAEENRGNEVPVFAARMFEVD